MALQNPPVSQTWSFSTVFLIEMWERFGFYGMQVLMVTYMMKKLGFVDTHANLVWGAAAALIYATPAIGGWVGDKLIGTRRTMVTGAVVLALGYALLWIPSNDPYLTYCALGVIIVGNGFFKPNAGNLVRKIYEGDDTRIDSAFTIYYMAVNVGSMLSMTATPWIREYVAARTGSDDWGWHTAFGACAVGLLFGLANYALMNRTLAHIGSPADEKPIDVKRVLMLLIASIAMVFVAAAVLQSLAIAKGAVILAGLVILGIFIYLISISQKSERAGLVAALVLTVQTIFFFVFYAQMATSLNLFAQGNVDLRFGLFGAEARVAGTTLRRRGRAGLFNQYVVSLTPWAPPGINLTQIQMANTRAQWRWSSKPLWNGKRTALAPEDVDFDRAAAWTLRVPTTWPSQVSNVFLQIQYQGDVARLYNAQHLLDDDFWNGMTWTVAIKDLKMGTQHGRAETWTLHILPLPKGFPMYLENKADLHYPTSGNLASLVSVKVIPQYQCTLLIHKAAPSE